MYRVRAWGPSPRRGAAASVLLSINVSVIISVSKIRTRSQSQQRATRTIREGCDWAEGGRQLREQEGRSRQGDPGGGAVSGAERCRAAAI